MRTTPMISILMLCAVFAVGCEQDSAVEDAAEAVEETADEVQDSAEDFGDDVEDAAEELDNT